MRKALFGILVSAILILSLSYYSIVSKEQDIFLDMWLKENP